MSILVLEAITVIKKPELIEVSMFKCWFHAGNFILVTPFPSFVASKFKFNATRVFTTGEGINIGHWLWTINIYQGALCVLCLKHVVSVSRFVNIRGKSVIMNEIVSVGVGLRRMRTRAHTCPEKFARVSSAEDDAMHSTFSSFQLKSILLVVPAI